MKLHQLLTPDRIMLDIRADNREDVIYQLTNVLEQIGAVQDHRPIMEMVLKRELQMGTGIGYGVAIPHTDPGPFPEPVGAFGRIRKGIDFHAPDGKPAQLIFLLLTPDKTPALHIRLLARICRLLKSKQLREQLLQAADAEQAAAAIAEAETDFPELNP